ncbi:MAG: transcription-repair coupling factor, partial [Treponema sp.]|nr:transcription-repair coupling factor [Treponema sp.]
MKSLTSIVNNWQELKDTLAKLTDKNQNFPAQIEGLHGSLSAFFVQNLCNSVNYKNLQYLQYNAGSKVKEVYNQFSPDIFVVVPGDYEAEMLFNDLAVVMPNAEVFILPSWSTIPYRPVPKGSVVFGKRAGVLSLMTQKSIQATVKSKNRIFIINQRIFLSPLPPPDYLHSFLFTLHKKDKIDTTNIAKKLTELGYMRVSRVNVRGEFSLRGEVLDIFLPLDENPTRIIFDFDEIESFKEFEPEAQITIGTKDSLLIYPMKEVLWNDDLIGQLEKNIDDYQDSAIKAREDSEENQAGIFNGHDSGVASDDLHIHLPFTDDALFVKETMLESLRTSKEAEGEELFYPLLWQKKYTILDYISDDAFVLFYDYDRLLNAELNIRREYNGMYRKTRESFPSLPVDYFALNFGELREKLLKCILFRTVLKDDEENSSFKLDTEPARSFFGNINYMKEELQKLNDDGWKVYIFTDNENQLLRIREIFKEYNVNLIPYPISAGFIVPEIKLLVIQENEIFGRRKYVPKSLTKAKSQVIDTFVELNPGDYVVHVNWGIGLFHGIERVKSLGNERDYIKLEYAEQEFAFVPIEQVNLVQRYIGNEGEKPRLDKIGSKSWENRKGKVKKAVEDLAQRLIDLYSRRKASVGYAFPKETEWQSAFEAVFPYEDTPDQITVTEEVKRDMEKTTPMDRLVCGDVGYGKTEIAMRAAFKAVMGGKQVAFLAPTTILAE